MQSRQVEEEDREVDLGTEVVRGISPDLGLETEKVEGKGNRIMTEIGRGTVIGLGRDPGVDRRIGGKIILVRDLTETGAVLNWRRTQLRERYVIVLFLFQNSE